MAAKLLRTTLFLCDYREVIGRICQVNPDAADRFCDAIENALEMLADHPQAGMLAGFARAPTVRKWVIQTFPKYIIYYQDRDDGVVLIRLLHGARNTPPLIPEG